MTMKGYWRWRVGRHWWIVFDNGTKVGPMTFRRALRWHQTDKPCELTEVYSEFKWKRAV